ncbi:MAG: type II CAAX endopeptidase family protein [Rikenellaceae bacterium]
MKKSITLILIQLLCLALSVLVSGFVASLLAGQLEQTAITLVSYTTMMSLTIILLRLFAPRYGWEISSFKPKFGRIDLSLVLLSLLTIEALGIIVEPVLSLIPSSYLDGMYMSMEGGMWSILTFTLAAPILEEFLFRGIMQRNLVKFVGSYWGIVLASFIFGAIHILPQQVIMAFLAGLVLGVVYHLTRSLFTVILIHLLNNGLAYMLTLFFGREVNYSNLFSLSSTSENYLYYGALAFVVLMGAISVRRIAAKDKGKRKK